MEQKLKDLLEEFGNELGWSVSFDGELITSVDFGRRSNAEQDFHNIVECTDSDVGQHIGNIGEYYENFDPE